MVIGTFFSEVGSGLLVRFSDFDPGLSDIRESLLVKNDWSHEEFARVAGRLRNNYPYLFSHAMRMNPFDKDASPVVLSGS